MLMINTFLPHAQWLGEKCGLMGYKNPARKTVACIVVGLRVRVNGQLTDGVSWVSIPYDLSVKREFTLPGGQRIVKELYDIRFVESDSSVFAIPQNHTLTTP